MIQYIPEQGLQNSEIHKIFNALKAQEEHWITELRRYHVILNASNKYKAHSLDHARVDPYFQAVCSIWKHAMRAHAHLLLFNHHNKAYERIPLIQSSEISYALEWRFCLDDHVKNEPILMIEHAYVVQLENARRHQKQLSLSYGPEEFSMASQLSSTEFVTNMQLFRYFPGNVFPILEGLLLATEVYTPEENVQHYLQKMILPDVTHLEMHRNERYCAETAIQFLLEQKSYCHLQPAWEMLMSTRVELTRNDIHTFFELLQSETGTLQALEF